MQETGDFLCKDVFLSSSEANMRVYSNQVSIFKCVFLVFLAQKEGILYQKKD